MPFVFFLPPVFLLFIGGQIYFAMRIRALLGRWIPNRAKLALARATGLGAYLALFAVNIFSARGATPSHMTLRYALVTAPFLWWLFSSTIAFFFVVLIWLIRLLAATTRSVAQFLARKPSTDAPASLERRQFLEHTATAAVAAPFVVGAYGFLWGRLNLQVTHQPIRVARLPRAFHGFRIAQLSDIHIGPFMSEDEIRKYVRIANELKPDLIALTGDFVTWDAATQYAVVKALSGLKAPFGVFGCLGNHDAWADAEGSLTALFAQAGVRILRQEHTLLRSAGDALNLMGIDFANSRRMSAGLGHLTSHTLEGVENLMSPGMVNILLSHNPDTFDRAA